jgi:ketosteroid isomerase-like protein
MDIEATKQLASRFFACFSANDVGGALELVADDAVWWIAGKPGEQPASGAHDKAWIGRLLGRMTDALDGPMPMTVLGMVAEGNRVAVEVRGHGKLRDGRRYENEYHFLITVRDGKIAAVREYLDTQHVVSTWFAPQPQPGAAAPAAG